MLRRYFLSFHSVINGCLLAVGGLAWTAPSFAVEPLGTFIEGARNSAFDAREQDATAEQRQWEARAALGRLLPALSVRGSFTHNQYQAELPAGTFPGQTDALTITPQNQWDGVFTLDVPLVDLAAHARYEQAKHLNRAAEIRKLSVDANLDRSVAQAYYTFIGASALVEAAEQSLRNAEENLAYVTSRHDLGLATDLDQERARANVEQTKQDLADANLISLTSSRNLETLSGLIPKKVEQYPEDDLRHEAPLAGWLDTRDTPSDRVQTELTKAANAARKSAHRALLPTLSANAQERITNATGFTGQVSSYTLQAVLAWRLDYNTYATAQAQTAAAEIQKISAERIRRDVEDAIYVAYHRVEASIIKSASARAQAQAAEKAAVLALERYKVGAVTQLDVTQSQRDAFQAQAAKVKADADLAYARVVLRVAAGEPLESPNTVQMTGQPLAVPIAPVKADTTPPPAPPTAPPAP